jgi:hypothetical protein
MGCNPYAALFALIAAIILSPCARKPGNNPLGREFIAGKNISTFPLDGQGGKGYNVFVRNPCQSQQKPYRLWRSTWVALAARVSLFLRPSFRLPFSSSSGSSLGFAVVPFTTCLPLRAKSFLPFGATRQ